MASSTPDQHNSDNLADIVRHLYPDALTRTYIVPPVHYNRVPYNKAKVPGTDVEVLVLPSGEQLQQQQAALQADFAQQHVLHNLQQLADRRKEVMFVVSELNFKDYLNKQFYAKQTGKLPEPANLPKELRHHGKQGDFDILVIHRQYGVLVGEIKSVGRTEASQADSEVAKVMGKAVRQLDKCEVHARHRVSDIAPGLTVSKTLFLPYVSRAQLQRVLDDRSNSMLRQAVLKSLGAASTAEAVELCCCSDQLSQPASYWHVTPAVLSQLSTWWQHRMACTVDTLLTDDTYLDIVARYQDVVLRTPLRTPPSVTRHVVQHRKLGQGRNVHDYNKSLTQDQGENVPKYVKPTVPSPTGHEDDKYAYDWRECRRRVAEILQTLGVGTAGPANPRALNREIDHAKPGVTEHTKMYIGTCCPQENCHDNGKSLQNPKTVFFVVSAEISASCEGYQTSRVDLFASDHRINTQPFRKQHGIRNVVASKELPVSGDAKARVRLQLRGEDKDSWRHCETQDGEKAFPEVQNLDLARILHHHSSFPVTAHWFLETPEKCPPSAHFEAVLEIQHVSQDDTSSTWKDGYENISILVEVGN